MQDVGRRFERDLAMNIFPAIGHRVVEEHNTKAKQRFRGDFSVEVLRTGEVKEIDAKAEFKRSENFPIELVQDWISGDMGWYYELRCDEIWYGRYTPTASPTLFDVHVIDFHKLWMIDDEVRKRWSVRKCSSGYGETILSLAPLKELVELGCAELLPSHLITTDSNKEMNRF